MSNLEMTDEIHKLVAVVSKATNDFISKTGNNPTHVILNKEDFNLGGEVEVCGFKVITSPLIPSGETLVVDQSKLRY